MKLNVLPNLGEVPKLISRNVTSGFEGNIATIKTMSKMARQRARLPFVRQFALNILHQYGIASQNHLDEAICIGQFVKENVRYARDPEGIELLTDPLTLIEQIGRGVAQGDCDDMSLLIATLLLSIGASPYFRAVRYTANKGHYNHIYVVVYDRNWGSSRKRVVLDAILKRDPIGTEVPHQSGDEYAV